MPITADDIARRLGLAQSTVSRVLFGSPNHRVAVSTKRRIEVAAREMGYSPNTLARSLRTKRTNTIGLYTSLRQDKDATCLPADFWIALRESCDSHGLDLLIHTHKPDVSAGVLFGQIVGGRTDGVIVYLSQDSPLRPHFCAAQLPVVSIGPLTGIAAVPLPADLDQADSERFWRETIRNAVAVLVHKICAIHDAYGTSVSRFDSIDIQ
jgi:DNA-binding LacI/PurR family transcriptional regulator